jgi:phosphatidylglycerophosphatase A
MDSNDKKPTGFVSRAAVVIASFFYVGYAPIASGTFGSLAAFALYFPLLYFNYWPAYVATIVFATLIGVWAAGRCEKDSGIVDPSFVVMDEVAGQLITLFLIPFSWTAAIAGFVLFRIMDIVKPFPANRAEHLPGGWGIMLDDVLAGIYGNLVLRLLLFALHRWTQM